MQDTDLTTTMRALQLRLQAILEADKDQPDSILDQPEDKSKPQPKAAPKTAPTLPPAPPPTEKPADVVQDLMTVPRTNNMITINSLATDLGIENADEFKRAFNSLRIGGLPSDPSQQAQLADAFCKLMNADAETVQTVINRLRSIYKKPLPSSSGVSS
jgi:hypothetical protein